MDSRLRSDWPALSKAVSRALAGTAFWIFVFVGSPLFSFSFSPMSVTLSDSGAKSIATIRLANDAAENIALMVRITTRAMDEAGVENNQGAGDKFVVFPSRFVIPPKGQRALKIQWRGGPVVGTNEIPFRLIVEEVPVQFEKTETSSIKLLMRYAGTLYVKPAKVLPSDVVVRSVEGVEVDGKRGVSLRLLNRGGTHAILSLPVLEFQDGEGLVRLSGETLNDVDGQNILPGCERRFFIPYEKARQGQPYQGSFSYEGEK